MRGAGLKTLAAIDTWYSEQTAAALLEFQKVIDVDGKPLLDNMVVPYVTEIARAYDHDFINSPVSVFGKGGGVSEGNVTAGSGGARVFSCGVSSFWRC